jgi:hypothetical protein
MHGQQNRVQKGYYYINMHGQQNRVQKGYYYINMHGQQNIKKVNRHIVFLTRLITG